MMNRTGKQKTYFFNIKLCFPARVYSNHRKVYYVGIFCRFLAANPSCEITGNNHNIVNYNTITSTSTNIILICSRRSDFGLFPSLK